MAFRCGEYFFWTAIWMPVDNIHLLIYLLPAATGPRNIITRSLLLDKFI